MQMLPFISNTPALLILHTLAAILKALATILKVPSLYLSNLPSSNLPNNNLATTSAKFTVWHVYGEQNVTW